MNSQDPVLAMQLANFISEKQRKFSYRIIFIPETIGAIIFLKKILRHLKKNLCSVVLSCVEIIKVSQKFLQEQEIL